MEHSTVVNNQQIHKSVTTMLELPSQVVDREYLRMPLVEKVVDSDEEWSRCGKWILQNFSRHPSWTDRAWASLQTLVEDGSLLMVKATTAAFGVSDQHVLCYTNPGREVIRRAAEAIRKVFHHESVMHYKINYLTEKKIGRRHGHNRPIAVYKHSYLGRFYGRDDLEMWNLEKDIDNEKETAVDVQHESNCWGDSEIPGNELPSKSRDAVLIRGPSSFQLLYADKKAPRQYIRTFGRLKEKEEGRLPEADRLWMAARRLLVKGVFKGIVCLKSPETAEFQFYVDHFLSPRTLAGICDSVFKAANCKGFMYFRTSKEVWADKVLFCKFSSEGEMYGNDKFMFSI